MRLQAELFHVRNHAGSFQSFFGSAYDFQRLYPIDGRDERGVDVSCDSGFYACPALAFDFGFGVVFVFDFAPFFDGFELGFYGSPSFPIIVEAVDELSFLVPHELFDAEVFKSPFLSIHGGGGTEFVAET